MAMVVLDAGMTNLALPMIAADLGITPALAVLVVTAYQTALLVALLPCAALGERLGYRRVFAAGAALFAGASLLAAIAPSAPWLVAARAVQGLGGAAIMALGVPLLRFIVPAGRLGAAIGWNALTVALASSAGPALGAAILSRAEWPWLYVVQAPLALAVLCAARQLPRTSASVQRLDLTSLALCAGVFGTFAVAAQLMLARPWLAVGLAIAGILCLGMIIRRESRKAAPLIPLDLLRTPAFRISVIASVLCFAGQTAALVALPFYLRGPLGQTTAATGFFMTVWPASVALTAVVVGRLADRFSTAWLCAAGGTCLAAGLLGAALWPFVGDLRPLVLLTGLSGIGFGLFQTPNNRNLFLSAPLERSAASGGAQGAARLTGQTAGAVLMTLLFTLGPSGFASRLGLGIGAVFALLAGLVSLARVESRQTARSAITT
ncbi:MULTISPECIES: MFS transporter [unclassified Brevundimonas]|uniref:MFS transporter n=1 Tax=unclassified Brevundimonas TaxID=2622653 RepID=UPI0025C0BD7D|nr:MULTISPECIES: MFS transporter [unclassified Brevundimonas]